MGGTSTQLEGRTLDAAANLLTDTAYVSGSTTRVTTYTNFLTLAGSNPPRAEVLLNTLKTFNMAPPGRAREETAETVERLRSLGYIGGGTAAVKETYTEADDPKRLIELEQMMQRGADVRCRTRR